MSRLSVITPSFNLMRYLPETVASVAKLESPHEHLIVDAASTDGTVDFLQSIEDPDVRWVSEPDRGQAHAMNKGIAMSEGDLIGWLNADDTYVEDAVDRSVAYLDEHPEVDAVYGWMEIVDGDGGLVETYRCGGFDWRRFLYLGDYIPTPSIIFRKRLLNERIPGLDESYLDSSDYDFYLRLLKGRNVQLMREPLVRFRYYEGSKTELNVRLRREAHDIRLKWARGPRDVAVMNLANRLQNLRNRVLKPWPETD